MGTVWRANDELLGRAVAVKELHVEVGLSPGEAENRRGRMLREARSVAQVKHPGVLVLHDIVQHDARPCLVMELIDGRSLAERIAAEGPVPPAEAAGIGLALLAALRAAHSAGVLHRDLKPANVLLEAGTGRVVLSDFGIAQVDGQATLTETGAFVGSPEYTAPERMSGKGGGPESDLWSLGVLLCAAVEGESPFRRDSVVEVLHAVVMDEIRLPDSAGPLLPVLHGLLERDPGRRLGTDEVERALRGFLAEERMPTVPRTPELPVPGAPRLSGDPASAPAGRGRIRTALLVGALVAVLAAGGTGAFVMTRDDSSTGREAREEASGGPESPSGDSGEPTPTRSENASEPPGDSAPEGYRTVSDPVGFKMAVPTGFVRSDEPPRVFYNSPDDAFRIGVHPQPLGPNGPLAVMREAHETGPSEYPGYRNGSVRETTHNGFPAAVWEFTWNGGADDGGPRRTIDLSWEEGGKLHDVWVSAPAVQSAEGERHFIEAYKSFVWTGS